MLFFTAVFFAVDLRTGKEIWSFKTEGQIIGAENIIEKGISGSKEEEVYAIFGSYDSKVYCLNVNDGKKG